MAPAIGAVKQRAAGARKHTPAGTAVGSAQAAALQPGTEQKRSAATATVNNLDAAKDGSKQVARETFKSAFKKAIEAATPKPTTEAEADKVVESGAKTASTTMQGQLATQKDAAVGPLKNPAASGSAAGLAARRRRKRRSKPEEAGPRPAPVSAAPVVPPPLPPERLDYSEDRAPTDKAMAENDVNKEQLEKGNEPAFGQTLQARSTAEQHEAQAEAKYRKSEANVQNQAERQAQGALAKGLGDVHGARGAADRQGGRPADRHQGARTRPSASASPRPSTASRSRRARDVETILKEMEAEASRIFGEGLAAAEAAYRNTFEEEKGGVGTWLTTWGDDWKELIESSLGKARREYLRQVDLAIDKVADCVDAKLEAAKKRVADGRTQVENFVKGLGASVQAVRRGSARQRVGRVRRDGVDDRRAQGRADRHADVAVQGIVRAHVGDGRGAAQRQQVAVGARLRRDRRPDQEDHRLQGHAAQHPGEGGRRHHRHHLGSDRVPRATSSPA